MYLLIKITGFWNFNYDNLYNKIGWNYLIAIIIYNLLAS